MVQITYRNSSFYCQNCVPNEEIAALVDAKSFSVCLKDIVENTIDQSMTLVSKSNVWSLFVWRRVEAMTLHGLIFPPYLVLNFRLDDLKSSMFTQKHIIKLLHNLLFNSLTFYFKHVVLMFLFPVAIYYNEKLRRSSTTAAALEQQ